MPAIEEERRRQRIVELRRTVLDPAHRFFLALLLNLPERAAIDRLIRSRFPEADPAEVAERWIAEIAPGGGLGIELDGAITRLLRGCLRGAGAEEILRQLRADFPAESVDAQAADIREACRRIVANPILRPLFQWPAA